MTLKCYEYSVIMRKMNYMECQKYSFELTENTQLDNAYFTKRSNILTF